MIQAFSSANPTGHYRLHLNIPTERLIAARLAEINEVDRTARKMSALPDTTSPTADGASHTHTIYKLYYVRELCNVLCAVGTLYKPFKYAQSLLYKIA
jgi:hypothetical protein